MNRLHQTFTAANTWCARLLLAGAALAITVGPAMAGSAGVTYVDSVDRFMAGATNVAIDRYDDLGAEELHNALWRSTFQGSQSAPYQVLAASGALWGIRAAWISPDNAPLPEMWLSTQVNRADLIFRLPSGPISALGGHFFVTDSTGAVDPDATVTVSAWDARGANLGSFTLTGGNDDRFAGLLMALPDQRIDTLRVQVASSSLANAYATVDDFRFGMTAPVPEPATALLWLVGLAGAAARAAKRRSVA